MLFFKLFSIVFLVAFFFSIHGDQEYGLLTCYDAYATGIEHQTYKAIVIGAPGKLTLKPTSVTFLDVGGMWNILWGRCDYVVTGKSDRVDDFLITVID